MTTGATRSERARLFVALDLPGPVRRQLVPWGSRSVSRFPGLRAVAPEALHVTLCFLGWCDSADIMPISDACVAAVSGAEEPELSLGSAVWLPPRRPSALAVEVADANGTLAGLQAALAAALSAGGWYASEARRFLGHVTVARVSRGARVRGIELKLPPAAGFRAASVTLYRSRLERAGARYEALRTIELGKED